MHLRRIIQHVKSQNWVAIILDFFIVLVGILIAFQVNSWSDRQADKRLLNVALERLYDEIQANIAAIDRYSIRHSEIMMSGESLLKLTRDPALDFVPTELLGKVFVNGYTTDYSTSALNSVLNQQTFQSLKNKDLRQYISSLPAEYLDAMEDELIVVQRLDSHWIPYISQKIPVGPLWELSYKGTEWESVFQSNKDEDTTLHSVSGVNQKDYDVVSISEFKELSSSLIFQNEIVNRTEYERLILIEQKELRDVLEQASALIDQEIN